MTVSTRASAAASAAALALALGVGSTALAQEVTLKANDGSASIRGKLLEYADGFYRIETELGVLRLAGSRMVCEGEACPDLGTVEADLVFAGSNTIGQGIMPLLMAGWAYSMGAEAEVENGPMDGSTVASLVADAGFGDPVGTYLIQASTSDDAFTALLDGEADVGMSARRIRPSEARALRADGAGNMVSVKQERIVAVDPVTVIVNPGNPVERITLDQLAAIYRGEITNWADLGGLDVPITVYGREPGSATGEYFADRVLGDGDGVSDVVMLVDDNNEMAAEVNTAPGGVGFVGYAFQRGAKPLSLVNACGITSTPSPFASKTEEYPLDRRLYLYAREDTLSDTVEEFFRYAVSEEADGVIAKAGFIDLGIARVSQDQTGGRMRDLIENTSDPYELSLMRDMLLEMMRWDRLSTTLRFASGSRALDERGEIDLERLISYLETEPEGTEVALVGFTDSDGAFEGNRSLAIQRATQVAREIEARAGDRVQHVDFQAFGFGELSPAACNDSAEGKRVNRRVEIWIRGGTATALNGG